METAHAQEQSPSVQPPRLSDALNDSTLARHPSRRQGQLAPLMSFNSVERRAHEMTTAPREYVKVLSVECVRALWRSTCTDAACLGHERRTLIDIVFEEGRASRRRTNQALPALPRQRRAARIPPRRCPDALQYGPGINSLRRAPATSRRCSRSSSVAAIDALPSLVRTLSEATLLGYVSTAPSRARRVGELTPSSCLLAMLESMHVDRDLVTRGPEKSSGFSVYSARHAHS